MDRRINLTSADVDALRRLLAGLDSMPATPEPFGAGRVIESSEQVRAAARIVRARRNRTKHFPPSMFGEPAWDMLLVLYTRGDEIRLTISRLAKLSDTRSSTCLRWLSFLEREGFVCRRPNYRDARSEFVELTERGRSKMAEYLSDTLGLLR